MQNRNVIDVDQLAFLWATLMTLIIVAQIHMQNASIFQMMPNKQLGKKGLPSKVYSCFLSIVLTLMKWILVKIGSVIELILLEFKPEMEWISNEF